MSFAPALRLELKQSQSLVLTPQLQQAIRLLQMSNLELASAIDREVADNPFLDHRDRASVATGGVGHAAPGDGPTAAGSVGAAPGGGPARADGHDEGWWQPPAGRAADCSLRLQRSSAQAFDEPGTSFEARLTRPATLREHLIEQIGAQVRDPAVRGVGRILVDLLDECGYLREPDALLAQRLRTPVEVVAAGRKALQGCEPTGIGACDLAECLTLQLIERDRFDPAMQALVANLPLLAKADFAELMRRCAIDAEDLQDMIAELKRLDPRPGRILAASEVASVVPDVFVLEGPGRTWRVELNAMNLPRVLVDRDYHAELCAGPLDRAARDYLSERFQSANWLAKALDQRARTMLKVTRSIFGRQRAFLEQGAQALRPLVLRDIAEATGLHESTVSRATAEKYVATPHGTFPLKFFFTTAIAATAAGGEAHSAEAIRQQIRRLIEREDRQEVLSDDQIVLELKQRGVAIARRTVAKYRESLGIASSVERRRMKALGR